MIKHSISETRNLIYKNQLKWFELYKSFTTNGKILVVGHGLGYTTEILFKQNPNVFALDVEMEKDARLKDKVSIYNGVTMPFDDNEFDVVIVTYVLHHAKDVLKLFSEIARVSKSTVVILEETYLNIFQKIDLVYYCWLFNRKAGQCVTINWNSYLTQTRIKELSQKFNFQIVLHKEESMRSYKTELFVLKK